MARRVCWDLTGTKGVYRYGGNGGQFDIAHVEVNEKSTRIWKRHPLLECLEQCAARYCFGQSRTHNIILQIRKNPVLKEDEVELIPYGMLEWPDFVVTVFVECRFHEDCAVTLVGKQLLSGSKDSGWEARFGEPSHKEEIAQIQLRSDFGNNVAAKPVHAQTESVRKFTNHY